MVKHQVAGVVNLSKVDALKAIDGNHNVRYVRKAVPGDEVPDTAIVSEQHPSKDEELTEGEIIHLYVPDSGGGGLGGFIKKYAFVIVAIQLVANAWMAYELLMARD